MTIEANRTTTPSTPDVPRPPLAVPDSWFRQLLFVAEGFPQGSPINSYIVGFRIFQSVLNGEMALGDIFDTQLDYSQIDLLIQRGDQYHAHLRPEGDRIRREWIIALWNGNMLGQLSRLTRRISDWQGPSEQDKLQAVTELFATANDSIRSEDGQRAGTRHRFLAQTDPEYRSRVCEQLALKPLYDKIHIDVNRKALRMREGLQVTVPEAILQWFSIY